MGLLHHILGHRYTKSLMAGNTETFWKDVELRIDPDPFLHIMSDIPNEKKARSKNPLISKPPFKLVL